MHPVSEAQGGGRDRVPVAYRAEPINAQSVRLAMEEFFMRHAVPSTEAADALKALDDLVELVMSSISSDRLALFAPQTFTPTQAVLNYISMVGNGISSLFNAAQSLIERACSGDDNIKCAEVVGKLPLFMRALPLLASRVSSFRLAVLSASSIFPMNKAAEAVFYARWVAAMPFAHEVPPQPQPPQEQAQQQQQQQQR